MIRVLLLLLFLVPSIAEGQIFADNYEPFTSADWICNNGVCRRAPLVKATLPSAAVVKQTLVTVSRPVVRTVQYVSEPVYVYRVPTYVYSNHSHYHSHRHSVWCRLRNR